MPDSPPAGPQPGMSQKDKDAAGAELRAYLERQAAPQADTDRTAGWASDDALERMDDDALAREADLRGVEVGGRNRKALITALKRARST